MDGCSMGLRFTGPDFLRRAQQTRAIYNMHDDNSATSKFSLP